MRTVTASAGVAIVVFTVAAEGAPPVEQAASEIASRMENIVVTARKRTESLQDVPVSIAVVTVDDIDRRGLVSAEDYLRGMPGVNQSRDHAGQSIVIRGIESQPGYQNWYSGTTVATYFGETPTTNSAGLSGGTNIDLKLVDIERVEVLRGPQGTAIGSSSLGGAVRTIPIAPKLDRFEGEVAAGYSSTSGYGGSNYRMQGVANIPLIADKLAIRAVAYRFDDSGIYRNRAGSSPEFRARLVEPLAAQDFANDRDDVGQQSAVGGRLAAAFQATEDLRFSLSYITQRTETDGYAMATSGTFEQTMLDVATENVHRGQRGGYSDTDIDIVNAVMDYDMGWANLVGTYSYLKGGSVNASSFSWMLPWALSEKGTSEQREHVGEVRLVTDWDGPWNLLAGVYLEKLKDTYSDIDYWAADPATNIFAPGQSYAGGIVADNRELKQRAVFGEVSWELVSKLTLTGGARAYRYDRTGYVITEGLFGDAETSVDADASGTSYRGNLSYKPNDESLIYGGYSQGFRLGKPQTGLPANLCDLNADGIADGTNVSIASTKQVNSDEVDGFELGGKFSLMGRRLAIDFALFRMEWEGMPVAVVAPPPPTGCALGYTANAGAARSQGAELQGQLRLTDKFRLDIGGAYTDAELTEDVPSAGFETGARLPGSPKYSANLGLQQELSLGNHRGFVRADAIYVGSIYSSVLTQNEGTRSGNYVKVDLTTRLTVRKFDIDLFVRNLLNEDAFTFRSNEDRTEYYGFRLRPRTIGVQLGYSF